MTDLTVVVAPDSFKGSVNAVEATDAIAKGWLHSRPDDLLGLLPQADGGEGTLRAIERHVRGSVRRSAGVVSGPSGAPVPGEWLELPDRTAVIELAQMAGLPLMPAPDPMGATTRGLGEVMAAALDAGAVRLIIGLGGSASTDGGSGALEALGSRRPPTGGVRLLTDVTAPLLGPYGAAAVFAPQKGATPEQVVALEHRLVDFSRTLNSDPNLPGTGAAGGAAFGLRSWGGTIESGAAYIAELSGLHPMIASADVVVTGEGRFDEQSIGGKLVGSIIQHAASVKVPVVIIAGSVEATVAVGPAVWTASLTELAGGLSAALAQPECWLRAAGMLAAEYSHGQSVLSAIER